MQSLSNQSRLNTRGTENQVDLDWEYLEQLLREQIEEWELMPIGHLRLEWEDSMEGWELMQDMNADLEWEEETKSPDYDEVKVKVKVEVDDKIGKDSKEKSKTPHQKHGEAKITVEEKRAASPVSRGEKGNWEEVLVEREKA